GPNYKRPAADVPATFRTTAAEAPATATSSASIGDEKFFEVFQDQQLQQLIRTAMQQNFDVRIAATRILEAQAQVGITRADQYPNVSVNGTGESLRNAATGPIPSYEFNFGRVSANAAWDLDFWGKYRRATEAARADLLASQAAQQEVVATLVANV